MRDMQPRFVNLLCKRNVTLNDRCLRRSWHSTQTQTKTRWPGMHRAILGDSCIFGVLHDGQVQLRTEAQRHPHDFVFKDRLTVIGHGNRTRALQCAEIGESTATAAFGRGCNREYIDRGTALWIL